MRSPLAGTCASNRLSSRSSGHCELCQRPAGDRQSAVAGAKRAVAFRDLRKACKLTQVRMAKRLGITQDSVSRLEQRSDLLLTTLRNAVEAMGGRLSLVAEFPDRAPVVLAGIAENDDAQNPRRHSRANRIARSRTSTDCATSRIRTRIFPPLLSRRSETR